jgi:hypothetical protein
MRDPVVPNGWQYELQQPLHPLQTVPSTAQEVLRRAQVPAVAPSATLHTPVQHSLSRKQISPGCVQYDTFDGAEQLLSTQVWLQHSALPPQALPAVLHVVLSGWQALLTH